MIPKFSVFNMIQEDIWSTIFSYIDGDTYRNVKESHSKFREIANHKYVIAELPMHVRVAYKMHKLFTSNAPIPTAYQSTPLFTASMWNDPLTDPQFLDDYLLIAPAVESKSMTGEFVNLKTKESKAITFAHKGGSYKIEGCEASKFPEPSYIIANQTDGLRILPLSILQNRVTIDVEQLDALSKPTPENFLTLSSRDPMTDHPHFPTSKMSPVFSLKDNILAIAYENHVEIKDLKNNLTILANFKSARKLSFHTTGELIATSDVECAIFVQLFLQKIEGDQKLEPNEIYRGSNFKFAKICGAKVVIAYQKCDYNSDEGVAIGKMFDRNTKKETMLMDKFNLRGEYVINHIENVDDSTFITGSNRFTSWSTNTQQEISFPGESINNNQWQNPINNLTKACGNYIISSTDKNILLYSKVKLNFFSFRSNLSQRLFDSYVNFASVKRFGSYLVAETIKWGNEQALKEQQVHVFDLTTDLRF